ncbi:MAG: hypothetical protein NVS9B12_09140 [Vulcanimicrobiaceae bacterium]
MHNFSRGIAVAALLALALAGCGGGKTASSTTTTTNANVPVTEAQRESAALPQGALAPVPAGLNCGATRPVWVNMHTRAYHEPGDPYYGRTKNGQYMCPSAAAAAGYHAAGSHHKGRYNSMNGSSSDESSMGGSPNSMEGSTGKHRHHKRGSYNSETAPYATPTP